MHAMLDSPQSLITRRTLRFAIAHRGVFRLLLYLEGRPAWCKSGLAVWSSAWNSCTSQNLLDPYSMSHVLHGVIFFWLLRPLADRVPLPWRLVAAVGLEIGWEVLENSPWVIARYRQDTAAFDYTGDTHSQLAAVATWSSTFARGFVTRCAVDVFELDAMARADVANIVMLLSDAATR